jgi:hypothetical protein
MLHFQTAQIKFNHFFSISFGESIFILVFLNFVFFIILTKASGVKSFDGVSHKFLEKIIFSIVFNLFLRSFSKDFSCIIIISSSFFLVL